MNYKIAVLPGDGIGPEVMGEGTQVLEQVAKLYGFGVELEQGIVGGASIDARGSQFDQTERRGIARRHGRPQVGRPRLLDSP
jgi:isocitrate/isopropylmalate dehydrogenase